MAEEPDTTKPGDGDESKLELPSLSLRRRKKKDKAVEEPPAEAIAETPVEAETPPVEEPEPAPEPTPAPEAEPAPVAEPAEEEPAEDEHTQVLPSAPEVERHDEPEPAAAAAPPPEKPAKVRKEPKQRQERAPFRLPPVSAPIAAAVTGAVIGLFIVGLTALSSRGCEAVRGTGSCGGIGLVFLIAILVLAVLLGAFLLKAWQIGDPMNSSFLAVGLVAVIAMLFFLSYIDEWWMVIVIPATSAVMYVLAWWITRSFVDDPGENEDEDARENAGARGL